MIFFLNSCINRIRYSCLLWFRDASIFISECLFHFFEITASIECLTTTLTFPLQMISRFLIFWLSFLLIIERLLLYHHMWFAPASTIKSIAWFRSPNANDRRETAPRSSCASSYVVTPADSWTSSYRLAVSIRCPQYRLEIFVLWRSMHWRSYYIRVAYIISAHRWFKALNLVSRRNYPILVWWLWTFLTLLRLCWWVLSVVILWSMLTGTNLR